MDKQYLKPRVLHLVPALGLFLIVQACGGGGDALADGVSADPLEGVYETVGTARDCATSAALSTFKGSTVFHHGGTLTETNAQPPATRGPGFGIWSRSGDQYTAKLRFFTYDPATGALTGSRRIVKTFTLSADKATATATITSDVLDAAGVKTGSTCATDVATRTF